MNLRRLSIVSVLALSLFVMFMAAPFALAQGTEQNRGLVTCTGVNCNFCELLKTGNKVINLLFQVLVIAAVVMIVVAGFKLVTSAGNVNAMQSAKGMLTNVIIGFVIVLAAWLIVDTIYKMLVGENSRFGMWNQLSGDCGGARNTSTEIAPQQNNPPNSPNSPNRPVLGQYCYASGGGVINPAVTFSCHASNDECSAANASRLTACKLIENVPNSNSPSYINGTWTQLGFNQYCNDVHGPGWVGTSGCSGTAPSGASCCVYNATYQVPNNQPIDPDDIGTSMYSNPEEIPPGLWCATDTPNVGNDVGYSCAGNSRLCEEEAYLIRSIGNSTVSACQQFPLAEAVTGSSNNLYCYATQGQSMPTCVQSLSECQRFNAIASGEGQIVSDCFAQTQPAN